MPRLLVIDTYYESFLESLYINPALSYDEELQRVLLLSFGTADFWSRNLLKLGWHAQDIIANSCDLQARWAYEHKLQEFDAYSILRAQIADFQPDVIISQNLSLDIPRPAGCIMAGQCSCPLPPDEKLKRYDVIFSSLPTHVEYFRSLGIQSHFVPLAFDPIILERVQCPRERVFDCVFVGGVGNPSHWKRGMETLEHVAREIPSFRWWGYGVETLPKDSALRPKYRGTAWGLDMYKILLQSKIVLNRHGEVAQGYANNMRLFEGSGCGALLLTEAARNLSEFFSDDEVLTYGSSDEAVWQISNRLSGSNSGEWIAANGQARTLRDHAYAHRMQTVSEVLTGMLCPV